MIMTTMTLTMHNGAEVEVNWCRQVEAPELVVKIMITKSKEDNNSNANDNDTDHNYIHNI